ncbi:N(5)-(carboxyethyl)ornithine synthase [Peribacillus sp. NPDC101481]|uniref:N(5)-(carboxyethyl)ornithine synthase n=1 Tax=Peribacillus sp. NPDC101481 TaxID=3364403 RepID=UPI003817EBD9
MRTVGFPVSLKENEFRRALVLKDILEFPYKSQLYFESGYGDVLGITDDDMITIGVNVVNRNEVLKQNIICDPKAGDADYLEQLSFGQIVFGWIHAVQNKDITDRFINKNMTAIAWEDMFEDGRHVFWRNNELAGEAAILHAYMLFGKMPYETKVAILGKGNIARGAQKALQGLGAEITIYDRKTENLLRKEIEQYDVFVNAILWDTNRSDHILYKEDIKRMKKNSMIIDISCDEGKGIETSKATTIANPFYYVDGVMHYVVDHTPSIFYKTASNSISMEVKKYLPIIMENNEENTKVLNKSIIIKEGKVLDDKILIFQNRIESLV